MFMHIDLVYFHVEMRSTVYTFTCCENQFFFSEICLQGSKINSSKLTLLSSAIKLLSCAFRAYFVNYDVTEH